MNFSVRVGFYTETSYVFHEDSFETAREAWDELDAIFASVSVEIDWAIVDIQGRPVTYGVRFEKGAA